MAQNSGLFGRDMRASAGRGPARDAGSGAAGGDDDATLAELRADCARMAARWAVPVPAAGTAVPPALLHGVRVPPGSARLVDGMSAYGG